MISLISATLLLFAGAACLTGRYWPIGLVCILLAGFLAIGIFTLCGSGPLHSCGIM